MKDNVLYALIAVVIVIGGFSIGAVYSQDVAVSQTSPGSQGNTQAAAASAYQLTLVIKPGNEFNKSVGHEPAYYVLSNGKLLSSANITLPSNTPIDVTIVNYDDGPATTAGQYANVTGTYNDQVSIFNDTNVNSTASGNSISVTGGSTVSYIPNGSISHTFTILSGSTVVVNIPVLPLSTEQASFTLSPGTYTWQCEAACGSGNSGWSGAMETAGWMTGTVYASSSVSAQSYYSLDLMITTSNWYNNTVTTQPAYFILNNGKLEPSQNITLPAGKKVVLTIINYDDGPAGVPSTYDNVVGTSSSNMFVFNMSTVHSTQGSSGIVLNASAPVSSVANSNIAHTFTIISSGSTVLNIPLPPSSTIQTSFTLNAGSYNWQCEAACGSGPSEWGGAMSTAGWMMGSVYAQ